MNFYFKGWDVIHNKWRYSEKTGLPFFWEQSLKGRYATVQKTTKQLKER